MHDGKTNRRHRKSETQHQLYVHIQMLQTVNQAGVISEAKSNVTREQNAGVATLTVSLASSPKTQSNICIPCGMSMDVPSANGASWESPKLAMLCLGTEGYVLCSWCTLGVPNTELGFRLHVMQGSNHPPQTSHRNIQLDDGWPESAEECSSCGIIILKRM